SIYGARAGNGVIVVTTKKGAYRKPLKIGWNSNISFRPRPDLSAYKVLGTSDFLDAEKMFYSMGLYDGDIEAVRNGNDYAVLLSPAVQLYDRQARGLVSQGEVDAQVAMWRGYNLNRDILKYMYRTAVQQQYSLSVSQGSDRFNYYLSAGYDKNAGSLY